MIDECEKGNLDIILTKSVNRFGRDTKEGLEAIRKIRSCGTRIIFETDKIAVSYTHLTLPTTERV